MGISPNLHYHCRLKDENKERDMPELMVMGYRVDTPIGSFARTSGLTYYSARKQLNQWTEGKKPKLLKTRRGQEYIYTEI